MDLERVRALRGPNIWARTTVLEVAVALGEMRMPAGRIPGFAARMRERFPSFAAKEARTLESGTLAHVLERLALALLQEAGVEATFGCTDASDAAGHFRVVVQYLEEEVGRKAVEDARRLIEAALQDGPFDRDETVRALRSLDEQVRLGPSTGAIVRAAQARGIPVRRLNDGSLVQLGWGSRGRRILAAETDRTSAIAESIAQDKELTKTLLRAAGVPVPEGQPAADAEEAWSFAQQLGAPVVVKPQYGNQGRGVAVNLRTREQVLAAFAAAKEEGSSILVERFASGGDHRVLVVGGRVVAAARREPPQVVGDGLQTVEQLVEQVNRDPRRGEDHATSLSKIRLDAIGLSVLAEQGYGPASVPPAGEVIVLRRNANLSTGGSAIDVTDQIHPEVAARAVDAARVVGLDIAGVDVICSDIGRPLEQQGGIIVEVNAAPGFRMHLEPSAGTPRPVGEAVIASMFDEGDDGRIPLVAVSGTNGKTTTVRLIGHLLRTSGVQVGMTCTDGIYVGERRIDSDDCSGPKSARAVLMNPAVEAAVLETARGGILREGLGFDRCDVAVVTNIGAGDHLGLNGIATVEQLAAVKGTIVDNVASDGTAVLNAADPFAPAMAARCPGTVTLFARDRRLPALVAHRARGGRALFVEAGRIVAAEGAREQQVVELAAVPLTLGGRIGFEVDNTLAAAGAAWALGLDWEAVRHGLATFVNDTRTAPGRFNVIRHAGATVVIDYGHNADALVALVEALGSLPHGRRTAVFSCAGDRRDVDILRQAEIVGAAFDEVILYEDACNRGRAEGEVMGLMRRGLSTSARAKKVLEIRGEFKAIETGLCHLRAGELIVVLVDQIDASLAFIEQSLARLAQVPAPHPAAPGARDPEPPTGTGPRRLTA